MCEYCIRWLRINIRKNSIVSQINACYKAVIKIANNIFRIAKIKSLKYNISSGKRYYNNQLLETNAQSIKLSNKMLENRLFNAFLLFSSLLFYFILNSSFFPILISVVSWDFLLALLISRYPSKKKIFLFFSISLNLGTLFFFKYAQFIALNVIEIINKMTNNGHLFNLQEEISGMDWILPLGISFFIFQSMSYTIDVYRGTIRPCSSWFDYCLYVSFFPQLVAGPIVKAKEFLPQVYERLSWTQVPLISAFSWIALGFFKKAVLADRLAEIVDFAYLNPNALDWSFGFISVLAYSFQIFLDFSGYSDIAIGIALLFGFRLPKNFNLPYLSSSFSEFWNRWHISLSSWLKDYLYISLGGNRVSALLTYRNLLLVMLLGGLWHGANWNFVIWGGSHGFFLAIERFFFDRIKLRPFQAKNDLWNQVLQLVIYKLFPTLIVFSVTSILWVFFRSPNLNIALDMINRILTLQSGINLPYAMLSSFFFVFLCLSVGHIAGKCKIHPEFWENTPFQFRHALVFSTIAILITLLSKPGKPFIYFVF